MLGVRGSIGRRDTSLQVEAFLNLYFWCSVYATCQQLCFEYISKRTWPGGQRKQLACPARWRRIRSIAAETQVQWLPVHEREAATSIQSQHRYSFTASMRLWELNHGHLGRTCLPSNLFLHFPTRPSILHTESKAVSPHGGRSLTFEFSFFASHNTIQSI